MRRITSKQTGFWPLLRQGLGFFFLFIWALGVILPVIPGWPALIFAIALLGRRNKALRLMHLYGRLTLRWMRRHPVPQVRPVGRWLSGKYIVMRRAVTPGIIAAERTFGG